MALSSYNIYMHNLRYMTIIKMFLIDVEFNRQDIEIYKPLNKLL